MPEDEIPQPDLSGEVAPEDVKAARQAFLSNPPAQINPEPEPAPVLDEEAAALDELTPPPAAADAGETPPAAAAGTPDPYAEFGGREAVATAMELDRALRTEQGVKLVIRQGLEALGYTDAQIRAALGGGPGQDPLTGAAPEQQAAPTGLEGFDLEDDDVVTGAQLKGIVKQATDSAVQQALAQAQAQLDPVRQQFEQERIREQASRNDQTLIELLGPVPEGESELAEYQAAAQDVLNAAQRYVEPGNFDPAHVRAGIVKAHADIQAAADARFKRYLESKKQARAAAPTNTGGFTSTEAEAAEPKNLKEARAMARAAGVFD